MTVCIAVVQTFQWSQRSCSAHLTWIIFSIDATTKTISSCAESWGATKCLQIPLKDLLRLLFGDVQAQISKRLLDLRRVYATCPHKNKPHKLPIWRFTQETSNHVSRLKKKIAAENGNLPSLFLSKLLKVSFSFFSCSLRYLENSLKSSPSFLSWSPEEMIFCRGR